MQHISLSSVCVQLLEELQQHRLFPLVEAGLRQTTKHMATDTFLNGTATEAILQQSSPSERAAERMTVYLLLAPKASWSFVQSKVRLLSGPASWLGRESWPGVCFVSRRCASCC